MCITDAPLLTRTSDKKPEVVVPLSRVLQAVVATSKRGQGTKLHDIQQHLSVDNQISAPDLEYGLEQLVKKGHIVNKRQQLASDLTKRYSSELLLVCNVVVDTARAWLARAAAVPSRELHIAYWQLHCNRGPVARTQTSF